MEWLWLSWVWSPAHLLLPFSHRRLQLMYKWLMQWDTQQPVSPPKFCSVHWVGLEEVSLNNLLDRSWLIIITVTAWAFRRIPLEKYDSDSKCWLTPLPLSLSPLKDGYPHPLGRTNSDTSLPGMRIQVVLLGGKEKSRQMENLYVEPTQCLGDPG